MVFLVTGSISYECYDSRLKYREVEVVNKSRVRGFLVASSRFVVCSSRTHSDFCSGPSLSIPLLLETSTFVSAGLVAHT